MHKFDYYPNPNQPDDGIELECSKGDLMEAASQVFTKWTNEGSLSEAIECACGAFWKEGELNALDTLLAKGNFWGYLIENCGFLNHDAVLDKAQDNAIALYLGGAE